MNSLSYLIVVILFSFVGCYSEKTITEPQPSSEYNEYLKKIAEELTEEERKEIREQLIADKEVIKLNDALVTTEENLAALNGNLSDDPFILSKQLEFLRWYRNPMFVMCDGIPWIPSKQLKNFSYLFEYRDKIREVSKSVGMIQLYHKIDGEELELIKGELATALAIGSNHIITNAHVLQESDLVFKRDGKWVLPRKIVLKGIFPNEYEFCKAREAGKEIVVTEIVEFNSDLNYVIFKTDSNNLVPTSMITDKVSEGDEIVVIGYPSTPYPGQDGLPLTFEQITRIYSTPDGNTPVSVLRLSPGQIMPKDRKEETNTYRHDASTWGASSGSIVMRLKDGAFIGLHQGSMQAKKEGVGFNFAIKIPFLTQKLTNKSTTQ